MIYTAIETLSLYQLRLIKKPCFIAPHWHSRPCLKCTIKAAFVAIENDAVMGCGIESAKP
jgi:hypothetical protein